MPQLFMIIDSIMEQTPIESRLSLNLILDLVATTEKFFGIEDKNDVAFTAVSAIKTFNEAPIQLEVRYTAGKDEYKTGQIFDPDEETRQRLATELKQVLQKYFRSLGITVWIKPFYNSIFK